jgi:hypothetical protein
MLSTICRLFAGVNDYIALGRPIVTYLIKAKRKGESPVVHGFDVYEVRQGDRIDLDQPAFTYHVGGDERLTIEVAAEDMGLPESASSFSIPFADICTIMESVGVVFEADDDLE